MTEHKGKFREPQYVNWVSSETDERSVLVSIDGRVSVADLLEYLRDRAPELPLDQVWIDSTLRWYRPATSEELAGREKWRADKTRRQEEWERRMWVRMLEKYGSEGPPPTSEG